ncbi:sec-independent protein translocase protein TatC [Flavobacteriaceae bacterium UJ101]|nr:sec-independent protein translocase protein TatC [Flavobacteriaceae bacterium UJ101]
MKEEKKEMSFLDHVEELRWHLVRSTIAIVIGAIICGVFIEKIVDDFLLGMVDPNFITYRGLNYFTESLGMGTPFSFSADQFHVQNLAVFGQFNTFLWVALVAGIILAFPYIVFEIWRFVKPALSEDEKKYASSFIGITSFLFLSGVAFGYFVISPLAIHFGYTFKISEKTENIFRLGDVISTITTSTLSMGVVFLIPIFIYFFTKIGLITPSFLKENRRFALVIILILAAFITPSDIFSMLVAAVPLYGLFEISIIVSTVVHKNNESEQSLSKTS